jgi:hypothetical protein
VDAPARGPDPARRLKHRSSTLWLGGRDSHNEKDDGVEPLPPSVTWLCMLPLLMCSASLALSQRSGCSCEMQHAYGDTGHRHLEVGGGRGRLYVFLELRQGWLRSQAQGWLRSQVSR